MNIETGPYPVMLEVFRDVDSYTERYTELRGYGPSIGGTGHTAIISDSHVLVGVFNNSPGTWVHEVNHFCIHVFEYVGLPITHASSEAYCYYMDYILEQVLNED